MYLQKFVTILSKLLLVEDFFFLSDIGNFLSTKYRGPPFKHQNHALMDYYIRLKLLFSAPPPITHSLQYLINKP